MTVKRDFVRDGAVVHAQLRHVGGDRYVLQLGFETHELRAARGSDGLLRIAFAGETHVAECAPCGKQLQVRTRGRTWTLEPARGRSKAGADATAGKTIEAPMTGTVTKVLVALGQQVEKGQTLVVLTAMKMEHKLAAGVAGKVVELAAKEGAIADAGTVLVRLDG